MAEVPVQPVEDWIEHPAGLGLSEGTFAPSFGRLPPGPLGGQRMADCREATEAGALFPVGIAKRGDERWRGTDDAEGCCAVTLW